MSKKPAGLTDVFVLMHIPAGSTVTDFDFQFTRSGGTPSVKVDMTAGVVGTHSDNTAVYVDPTDSPELVQICPPDAAFAPGVDSVVLTVYNPNEGWQVDKEIEIEHSYDGAVWWENGVSNSNTRPGVDGTRQRPVDDQAALATLLSATGLNKAIIKQGLVLSTDLSGNEFIGGRSTPASNIFGSAGMDLSDCVIRNMRILAEVHGNEHTRFIDCILEAIVTRCEGQFVRCGLDSSNKDFGASSGVPSSFIDCYQVENTSPLLSLVGTTFPVFLHNFKGKVRLHFSGSETAHVYSNGVTSVEVAATSNNGNIILHGTGNFVDNGTNTNVDLSDWEELPLNNVSANVDQWAGNPVTGDGDWAELQTDVDNILVDTADIAAIKAKTDQLDFNLNGFVKSALTNIETSGVDSITESFGKWLNSIIKGTTQGGGHTTTSINSNATGVDEANAVVGSLIVFQHNAGDNKYAARVITANGEANGAFTFSPALPQIPPDGDQFFILPAGFNTDGATLTNQVDILSRIGTPADLGSGPDLAGNTVDIQSRLDFLRNGTAQAGAVGSITLDAGASAVDDFYNRLVVGIISGTGAGQAKRITDYNGTTKVATVDSNWATTPDATSVFTLFPFAEVPVDINAIRDAILSDSTPFNGSDIAAIKDVTDILNSVDGVGLADREKFLLAFIKGKITRSGNAFTYFEQNGTTPAYTLTGSTGERTPS